MHKVKTDGLTIHRGEEKKYLAKHHRFTVKDEIETEDEDGQPIKWNIVDYNGEEWWVKQQDMNKAKPCKY